MRQPPAQQVRSAVAPGCCSADRTPSDLRQRRISGLGFGPSRSEDAPSATQREMDARRVGKRAGLCALCLFLRGCLAVGNLIGIRRKRPGAAVRLRGVGGHPRPILGLLGLPVRRLRHVRLGAS